MGSWTSGATVGITVQKRDDMAQRSCGFACVGAYTGFVWGELDVVFTSSWDDIVVSRNGECANHISMFQNAALIDHLCMLADCTTTHITYADSPHITPARFFYSTMWIIVEEESHYAHLLCLRLCVSICGDGSRTLHQ